MDTKPICTCENLSKSYGQHQVLNDCNLELFEGELVGLVGENGSGKSTFVRCLLGFTPATRGSVTFNGSVGYCPQENLLNLNYTLREHLMLVTAIYRLHCAVDTAFTVSLVDHFRLGDYIDRPIRELSSGTRQKVQFVSSILHRPDLLILDEPYDGFDWEMYLVFWEILEQQKEEGCGALVITHLIYDHSKFSRIIALENGKLHDFRP